MIKIIRTVQILTLYCLISGCSFRSIGKYNPWYRYNNVESVSVYVAPDPNLHMAIRIDVVFIYSQQALKMVENIDGQEWFDSKPALVSVNASEIDVLQWELVPGYLDDNKVLPIDHKNAIKVLAFIYLPGSQKSRVDITHLVSPRLVVESKQLVVKVQ